MSKIYIEYIAGGKLYKIAVIGRSHAIIIICGSACGSSRREQDHKPGRLVPSFFLLPNLVNKACFGARTSLIIYYANFVLYTSLYLYRLSADCVWFSLFCC